MEDELWGRRWVWFGLVLTVTIYRELPPFDTDRRVNSGKWSPDLSRASDVFKQGGVKKRTTLPDYYNTLFREDT